jgi:hypothetical protein
VKAATAVAATTMEATTAAMETTAATSSATVAAVLGERGDGRADEDKRSDTCKKSLQQGGFRHINSLHRNGRWLPGRANRLYQSYLLLDTHSKPEVARVGRKSGLRALGGITRGLGKESEVGGRDFSPITGVVALQFADKPQRSSSAEDLI